MFRQQNRVSHRSGRSRSMNVSGVGLRRGVLILVPQRSPLVPHNIRQFFTMSSRAWSQGSAFHAGSWCSLRLVMSTVVRLDSIHRSTSTGRKRKSRLENLTARRRPRFTSSSINRSLVPRNLASSRFVKGLPACLAAGSSVLLVRDRSSVDCFACMREDSMLDFSTPRPKTSPKLHRNDLTCANMC